MFSIIAAIGKNNELGKDGGLIFRIKEDLQFFRNKTMGRKIVMGRKTWESLPDKLPGRENIVISSHEFKGPDLLVHDINDLIKKYQDSQEEVFVIGGGTVYLQFLPYAKTIYLTEIDATDPSATTFFPEFDKTRYHKEIIKQGSENGLDYTIAKYTKEEL